MQSEPQDSPRATDTGAESRSESISAPISKVDFSYPTAAIVADLVRALPGLGLCGALGGVAAFDGSPILAGFFFLVASLFLWLAGQAVVRMRRSWRLDAAGLVVLPRGRDYPWQELREWRLRYWAGFRQAREGRGTLALTLYFRASGGAGGKSKTLRFESSLVGFRDLVAEVAERASEVGALADDHTRHNFQALFENSSKT